MFIQDQVVQTLHFSSELFHSESCQNAWMPENRSSEAASFRQYSPGHVAWRVNDNHHLAIAEEALDLWEHEMVPFQPGIRAEMRLNVVPSLLVNRNVRLARLELDQRLHRGSAILVFAE